MKMYKNESIEHLENDHWPEPNEDEYPLVKRCHRFRQIPIKDLTIGQIALLLRQSIGVKFLMSTALEILCDDPFIEGDNYPGDLLAAILKQPENLWIEHKALENELKTTLLLYMDRCPDRKLKGEIEAFMIRI